MEYTHQPVDGRSIARTHFGVRAFNRAHQCPTSSLIIVTGNYHASHHRVGLVGSFVGAHPLPGMVGRLRSVIHSKRRTIRAQAHAIQGAEHSRKRHVMGNECKSIWNTGAVGIGLVPQEYLNSQDSLGEVDVFILSELRTERFQRFETS